MSEKHIGKVIQVIGPVLDLSLIHIYGVDARVIMPLYGDLKFRDKLEYVTNYSVPVGWRSQYCGLFKACLLYTSKLLKNPTKFFNIRE